MTLALRARARGAARARASASSTSSTTSSGASSAKRARLSRATTARPAPALSAAVDEVVAVAVVALEREERVARRQRAACRSRCRHGRPAARRAVCARIALRPSPRRSRARLMPTFARAAPRRPRRDRRTAASASPTIWPVSWPLPAISSTSPGSSSAMRGADRLARGRRSRRAPGRAGQDGGADRGRIFAARIVVGDDDAVGVLGRDRAHQRPLARSRSPPAPNTTTSLPLGVGPQRLERLRQRVRLVRVVDEDRRAVARRRRARAGPWRPCSVRARRTRAPASPPVAMASPAATSAFSTWKRADQRQLDCDASRRHARRVTTCAKPSIARADEPDAVALRADRHDACRPRCFAAATTCVGVAHRRRRSPPRRRGATSVSNRRSLAAR